MKLLNVKDIDFNSIQNIIFDWGGVITNIDYHLTVNAFNVLGFNNFHEYFTQQIQHDLFRKFEIGAISPGQLRDEIRQIIGKQISDEQIDNAWCAMLLDTPRENIDLLIQASKKFRIFLLSNTNEIHVNFYNKLLRETLGIDYPAIFEKAYYSNSIGKRKPNADAFDFVLNDKQLVPGQTLFIDDTEMHVDGAGKLGINAFYLAPGLKLKHLFDKADIL